MDDASEGAHSSENEWQGGDDEEDNEFEGDDEEEMSGDESVVNGEPPSLVVQLRYTKGKAPSSPRGPQGNVQPPETKTQSSAHEQSEISGLGASKEPPAALDPEHTAAAQASAAPSGQNVESQKNTEGHSKETTALPQSTTGTNVPAHPPITLPKPSEAA